MRRRRSSRDGPSGYRRAAASRADRCGLVETREVRDLVQAAGADMAQGYFFGCPAPFNDFINTLRQADR
jgi:hypothetical protein